MKLKIEIDCDDDCMSVKEVKRILSTLNDRITLHSNKYPRQLRFGGKLLTIDGNNCGHFEFEPE
jgi:hypothetical protein